MSLFEIHFPHPKAVYRHICNIAFLPAVWIASRFRISALLQAPVIQSPGFGTVSTRLYCCKDTGTILSVFCLCLINMSFISNITIYCFGDGFTESFICLSHNLHHKEKPYDWENGLLTP